MKSAFLLYVSTFFLCSSSKLSRDRMMQLSGMLTFMAIFLAMSRQVSEEILREADLILAMSKSHTELIGSHYPRCSEKVYDLTRYVDEFGDLEDPYGGSLKQYALCRNRLAFLIEKLVVKLKKRQQQESTHE